MKLLRTLVRPARTLLILSILAGVVSGGCGVALIALVQDALGRGTAGARGLAVAFAGLCLVAALTRVVAQAATIRLAYGSVSRLCVDLCRKVLALPLRNFETIDHAGLLAVLTEDIGLVAGSLASLPLICLNVAIVAICLVYVGWLAPSVLASGVVFLIVGGLGHWLVSGEGMRQLRSARSAQDDLVGHFRTLIGGFRELKQHRGRCEAFLADSLEIAARSVRDRSVTGLTSFAVAATWGQVAYFAFIGFVIFALPEMVVIDGRALAGSVLVVLYLMVPLDILMMWGSTLARTRASLFRIEAMVPMLDGSEPAEGSSVIPPFRESLCLEGITYAYGRGADREGFALGPVDLTIRPGDLLFVAGGNGSGKTTLIKMIAGLYAPDAGTIRLDGRAIGPADREGYRQLFSVVFADGHVFRDLQGIDLEGLDDRARDYLARLGLDRHLQVERGAFSTVDLSQGQRRRLALLTACLEDRPICIFDEWAANQDPSFKKVFYLELLPELRVKGKTLIVISHDDDYQDVADRVLRLRDGQLVEDAAVADAIA